MNKWLTLVPTHLCRCSHKPQQTQDHVCLLCTHTHMLPRPRGILTCCIDCSPRPQTSQLESDALTLTPHGTTPWSSTYHEQKDPSLVFCQGQLKADSQENFRLPATGDLRIRPSPSRPPGVIILRLAYNQGMSTSLILGPSAQVLQATLCSAWGPDTCGPVPLPSLTPSPVLSAYLCLQPHLLLSLASVTLLHSTHPAHRLCRPLRPGAGPSGLTRMHTPVHVIRSHTPPSLSHSFGTDPQPQPSEAPGPLPRDVGNLTLG